MLVFLIPVGIYAVGVLGVFLYTIRQPWHFGPIPKLLVCILISLTWPLELWRRFRPSR